MTDKHFVFALFILLHELDVNVFLVIIIIFVNESIILEKELSWNEFKASGEKIIKNFLFVVNKQNNLDFIWF